MSVGLFLCFASEQNVQRIHSNDLASKRANDMENKECSLNMQLR